MTRMSCRERLDIGGFLPQPDGHDREVQRIRTEALEQIKRITDVDANLRRPPPQIILAEANKPLADGGFAFCLSQRF